MQDSITRVANRVHTNSFGEEMVVIIEAHVSKIETMEDRRYAAMLDKDVKTLRSIFHDQLTHVHSSGVTDTKASYIAGLETGVWDTGAYGGRSRRLKCKDRWRSFSIASR